MPRSDAVQAVADELRALAGADRRAVLRALDREERALLTAALRRPDPAAGAQAPMRPLAHSAWFDALKASAARGDEAAMTSGARSALLDALAAHRDVQPRGPGRSLLEAAGGLIGGGRAR